MHHRLRQQKQRDDTLPETLDDKAVSLHYDSYEYIRSCEYSTQQAAGNKSRRLTTNLILSILSEKKDIYFSYKFQSINNKFAIKIKVDVDHKQVHARC